MNKHRMYGRGRGKGWFFLIIPAVVAAAGLAVMWLWNAVLPEVLGVKAISFWQAVGLFLLCKLLFGNFRGPGRVRGGPGFGGFRERMMNATPEEREALKKEWRRRCRNQGD